MAEKHPYTSGQSGLTQTIAQLRKSFPAVFNADTLKKLTIAPNNESYVLNILKFLAIIDAENKKVPAAEKAFLKHGDDEFKEAFAKLVFDAYHDLFELYGPGAWDLDIGKLIGFFRQSDSSSDVVGKRQATTFQTLARLAGKLADDGGATAIAKPRTSPPAKRTPKSKTAQTPAPSAQTQLPEVDATPSPPPNGLKPSSSSPMALTVRVEINLPAGGDQQTYDAIFKSIRENLLNGTA